MCQRLQKKGVSSAIFEKHTVFSKGIVSYTNGSRKLFDPVLVADHTSSIV